MLALMNALTQVTTRLTGVNLHPIRVLVAGVNGVTDLKPGQVSRVLGRADRDWREAEHTIIVHADLLAPDMETELQASIWHAIPWISDVQAEYEHFSEDLEDLGRALPPLDGEDEEDPDYLMRVREHFAQAMTEAETPLEDGSDWGWPETHWSAELIRRMREVLDE